MPNMGTSVKLARRSPMRGRPVRCAAVEWKEDEVPIMKQLWAVVGVCAVGAVGLMAQGGVQAPALPTVDQVLDRNVTAMGGRAALEKVTSITARGSISVPEAGLTGNFELYQKAPDKALTVVDFGGQGQREGFDGVVGWAVDLQSGLREKSGVELVEAKRGAVFSRELRMKSLYRTLTVTGRERIGTRDAIVVEAVPAEGTPTRLFYDAESGLLVRQLVTRQSADGPMEVEITFEDFRAVDGVMRPFTIRQAVSTFTAVVQLSEIRQNVPVDDAMFKKPGI